MIGSGMITISYRQVRTQNRAQTFGSQSACKVSDWRLQSRRWRLGNNQSAWSSQSPPSERRWTVTFCSSNVETDVWNVSEEAFNEKKTEFWGSRSTEELISLNINRFWMLILCSLQQSSSCSETGNVFNICQNFWWICSNKKVETGHKSLHMLRLLFLKVDLLKTTLTNGLI